jgi:Ring finger domain
MDEARVNILSKLKGIPYANILFSQPNEGNECAICLNEFGKDEQVVQLKCHPSHIFHENCIGDTIKKGKPLCPLCRAPIDQ